MNAYCKVENREDGSYLHFYPATESGCALTIEMVISYLKAIGVDRYDKIALYKAMGSNAEEFIKLSGNKQSPARENIRVELRNEDYSAVVTLFPPTPGGELLEYDDLVIILKKNGVHACLLEQVIRELLQQRVYFTEVEVARGKKVVQGKNGRIEYFFNVNAKPHPTLLEDGRVDYHQMNAISNVKEGDKLATWIRLIQGKPGLKVTGKTVKPDKVTEPKFTPSKYTGLSEDGHTMYALVAGHVYLIEDKIMVSNTYEVSSHVDASTGDIIYDGDILVKGNVTGGFKIKATGTIVVEGMVEDAVIEADGPIVINGGVQGRERGRIISQNDVTIRYIENAYIYAGGDLQADFIMHSKVYVKNKIIVNGKKGLIVGGETKAGESITLKLAGSRVGTVTNLEVGLNPDYKLKYNHIQKELPVLEKQKDQLMQLMQLFNQRLQKGIKFSAEQLITAKKTAEQLKFVIHQVEELSSELSAIENEMEQSGDGIIIVEDMVYPGVKITICNAFRHIKAETHYCRFQKEGEDIVIKAFT